jgi:hypothetical protein
MLLPAFVALFGVVAALFLLGFGSNRSAGHPEPGHAGEHPDDYPDDDEYVEIVLTDGSPTAGPPYDAPTDPQDDRWQYILERLMQDAPPEDPLPGRGPHRG